MPDDLRKCHSNRTPAIVATTRVGEVSYSLRLLSFNDYRAWRTTRLRCEKFLAPAFGSPETPWAEMNSRSAWIEWATPLIQRTRRRHSFPLTIIRHTPDGDELVGEMGMSGVDEATRCGEVYGWAIDVPSGLAPWTMAHVLKTVLGPSYQIERIVGPVALINKPAQRGLERAGMSLRSQRRNLRLYGGTPHDHGLWVIDNTPANRALVAEVAR